MKGEREEFNLYMIMRWVSKGSNDDVFKSFALADPPAVVLPHSGWSTKTMLFYYFTILRMRDPKSNHHHLIIGFGGACLLLFFFLLLLLFLLLFQCPYSGTPPPPPHFKCFSSLLTHFNYSLHYLYT